MLLYVIGKVTVIVDGKEVKYDFKEIPLNRACPHLNGRFAVKVTVPPDGRRHYIALKIKELGKARDKFGEGGENLEMQSFLINDMKVSLGVECDNCCLEDGEIPLYDYNSAFLSDGIAYITNESTVTSDFIFGIAWISPWSEENDLETWFGADPTLFY